MLTEVSSAICPTSPFPFSRLPQARQIRWPHEEGGGEGRGAAWIGVTDANTEKRQLLTMQKTEQKTMYALTKIKGVGRRVSCNNPQPTPGAGRRHFSISAEEETNAGFA
jgi:hypothetical protein